MTEGSVRLKSTRPVYRRAGVALSSASWLVLAGAELSREQQIRLAADDVVLFEVGEPTGEDGAIKWTALPPEVREQARAIIALPGFLAALDGGLVPNEDVDAALSSQTVGGGPSDLQPPAADATTTVAPGEAAAPPTNSALSPMEPVPDAAKPGADAAAAPVVEPTEINPQPTLDGSESAHTAASDTSATAPADAATAPGSDAQTTGATEGKTGAPALDATLSPASGGEAKQLEAGTAPAPVVELTKAAPAPKAPASTKKPRPKAPAEPKAAKPKAAKATKAAEGAGAAK